MGSTGSLGLWVHRSRKEARSGMTEGVQREGLRCGINGEAGTWVHRSRKEARSGMTEGVQREGLRCGINGRSWDSGVQIWDGRCCERTLDVLPTDGLWNDKCVCLICE